MTRRRPPRVFTERLVGAVESMIPGTVGGRVSNAGPVPAGSATAAVSRGVAGTTSQASGVLFKRDRFVLASDGAQDLTLTYLPMTDSEHVYLRGVQQDEGTDWTRDGLTLSLLSPMDALTDDVIEVRYAYDVGAPLRAGDPIGPGLFVNGGGNGDTGSTATVSMPSGLAAGDLLIAAVMTRLTTGTYVTPSGWTHEGSDANLGVYSKISDGTETDVTVALGATGGWAAVLQIYRGANIRVASSAFGPSASTSTTCDLPSAAVSGHPLAVEIWGGTHTFSGAVNLVAPGTTSNVTTGTEPGREVIAGSEALTGVTTTPTRQATGTVNDVWGAAVLTVAVDE